MLGVRRRQAFNKRGKTIVLQGLRGPIARFLTERVCSVNCAKCGFGISIRLYYVRYLLNTHRDIKQLVCVRTDRLGARLLNLFAGVIIARRLGLQVSILWPTSTKVLGEFQTGYRVGEVFDTQLTTRAAGDISFEEVDYPSKVLLSFTELVCKRVKSKALNEITLPDLEVEENYYIYGGMVPASALNCPVFRSECAMLSSQLRFRPEILHSADVFGATMTAVHIRRGDVPSIGLQALEAIELGQKSEALYKFSLFRSLSAPLTSYNLGDGTYRLFSDLPEMGIRLQQMYPNSKIEIHWDNPNFSPLQQAACAIVTMSRFTAIVGGRSAFARAASIIGNVPLKDVSRNLSNEEYLSMLREEVIPSALESEKRSLWYRALPKLADVIFA